MVIGADARPMRKDAARNRALLITAAREVFARRGLEASLDEVARHAGVGIGTAYRHFSNKFELAEAIMHNAIQEIVAAAVRATDVEDPWQALVFFLEDILEVQTKDRGLREVMMGVHTEHQFREAFDLLGQPVASILQRAQRAGAVRADVTPTDLGCILTMLCEISDLAGDTAPNLWRRYFPPLLAGLRAGGPVLSEEPLTDLQFRAAYEGRQAQRLRHASN
jgi:AcrR family transcriptional regulator